MESPKDGESTAVNNKNSTSSRYKRSVGTYVPPAKRVKSEKFDVGSEDYQRCQWNENKKKITGLINRANISNVTIIVKELFKCNLIRYKGLFVSALLKAQETSSVYTDIYAALLAIINSRIKTIGLLLTNRLILQYRSSFISNNKAKCLATVKFIAHLTNQEVVHEVLAFELVHHLISKPTPASIEIVITFIKECGSKLDQLNKPYLFEVFQTLRYLSLEKNLDTRTDEMIHILHNIRKTNFKDYPPIKPALDLVEEDDKVTHTIELSAPKKDDFHMELNYFKFDPNWSENEAKYENFKKSLLEDNDDDSDTSSDDDGVDSESSDDSDKNRKDAASKVDDSRIKKEIELKEEEKEGNEDKKDIKPIIDATGIDVTAFRRQVYLIIRSSATHEEVVQKLLKAKIKPELNDELCTMILDCCGQESTYGSVYGTVASKLCQINRREFAPRFERIFQLFYETVHRFETNKIRNIAKFYSHLLATESIDWYCLACLKLRENATSSAGRCFIKFLFQELVSILSLPTLIEYIKEPTKEGAFKDLFPKDEEQDIRFAINFFTFCGLGQLTEDLRQELLSRQ